jgi:predicted Rossmann fold flavoprotein
MQTDICIIGAGPAGVFASIFAAQSGAKVLIIERNTSACRKLLRTGRTRCNITHTGSVRDFIKAYDHSGRFLRHCLYEFSAEDLRNYFAERGLKTKAQKNGCVFPATDRATDIAWVLLEDAEECSVRFMYGGRVRTIQRQKDDFMITTDKDKISASVVIIATGGLSWPFTGSTGDGYELAKSFGHTIVDPKAALCPLLTAEAWPGKLQGVGAPDVVIRAKIKDRKFNVRGALMFTENGIGGPAVFDLSRLITDYLPDYNNPVQVTVDLLPKYDSSQFDKEIVSICSKHPKKTVVATVARFITKSLALQLCKLIDLPQSHLCSQLTKTQRGELVRLLKSLPLSIVASAPIDEATITCGGVSTDDIDPETMESRICRGLYFAGEIIDVDGPCGGYNLQIAFSTGRLAGLSAAENI